MAIRSAQDITNAAQDFLAALLTFSFASEKQRKTTPRLLQMGGGGMEGRGGGGLHAMPPLQDKLFARLLT